MILTVSIMYCFLVVFPSTVYDVLKTYPRHLSSICVEIIKKYRLTAEAQWDTMQTFKNVLGVVFMKLLLSLCFVKTYYRRYRNWAFYNALWYWLGIRQKKIPQEKCRKICRKYNKPIGSLESPPPTRMHLFLQYRLSKCQTSALARKFCRIISLCLYTESHFNYFVIREVITALKGYSYNHTVTNINLLSFIKDMQWH